MERYNPSYYIFTSLTRISDMEEKEFGLEVLDRSEWATGDYVVCRITDPGGTSLQLELPNGRMRGVIGDEYVVGALGERFATLEATGTWKKVGTDGKMSILTGGGIFGKLTSKSAFMPNMMQIKYTGHAVRKGRKITMDNFLPEVAYKEFQTPVVLFIGTSMSAGKTTSARIVTNIFKSSNYKVVGVKLTGAGRYKDILALKDVGADAVFDFVDVGLPSSICPREVFQEKIKRLLSLAAHQYADIAIVEVGASPMEPYNGDLAVEALGENIKCTILSATDPYSVYGLMKAFKVVPDIVSGITTNTLAGIKMVRDLCGVQAMNLIDSRTNAKLREILREKTGLAL
ncbi:hypothetical protein SAMN06265375_102138 [Muriicola jejuensis]|uniref:DUF1611 domain-containing protein n=1 Tax=Muriicola jejuensis TaxID=504488 RepID=A0A6P0UEI5_9FLAO|nr:hypothetical protein [Muriicola jejuensis]NER10880.1 hypothetical protein [Muriicola jejuensis]SMP15867.1 hypothetical protein SAMN06265375_102138 [Muriicola jejuensis]